MRRKLPTLPRPIVLRGLLYNAQLPESRTANTCQQVQPGSGLHCVTLYPDDGCPTGLEELIEHSRDAQCTNVNSGIVPRSFRCSESNLCISS